MRLSRKKTSRPKRRHNPQKRTSSPWRILATFRRFWAKRFFRSMCILGLGGFIAALLWWVEYPQRLGRYVGNTCIAATGRIGFSLQDVMVEGRHNASLDKILKVVNVQRGAPLLSYDPYLIKKKLEEISWIQEATVKRQLPGIIFIQLKERQPVALWQHRHKYYLVDEKGVIISSDNLQAFAQLPLIVGEDAPVHAPQILGLLEKFPSIQQKVTALVRIGGRRWDLHLNKNLHVKLPELKVEEALKRLSILIEHKAFNPLEVAVIDLRVNSQTVMRLSPKASVRLKGKGKET